jgi:hypothetical protein
VRRRTGVGTATLQWHVFQVCIIWTEGPLGDGSFERRLQRWMSWGGYNETWESNDIQGNDRGLFERHCNPVIGCNTSFIVRRQLSVTHWSHLFHLGHDVNWQGLPKGVSFEGIVHLRISFGYMGVVVLQCVEENNDLYSELLLCAYTYVFRCIYVGPLYECMLEGRHYVWTYTKPSPFRLQLIQIEIRNEKFSLWIASCCVLILYVSFVFPVKHNNIPINSLIYHCA